MKSKKKPSTMMARTRGGGTRGRRKTTGTNRPLVGGGRTTEEGCVGASPHSRDEGNFGEGLTKTNIEGEEEMSRGGETILTGEEAISGGGEAAIAGGGEDATIGPNSRKSNKRKAKKKVEPESEDSEDEEDLMERFEFEIEEDVSRFVDELSIGRKEIPESSDEDEDPMVIRSRRIRRDTSEKLVLGQSFLNGIEFKEACLDHVYGLFSKDFWSFTYESNIIPLRGPKCWMHSGYRLVTAPTPPTPPGRKKGTKKTYPRIKGKHESPKKKTKKETLSRIGRIMHCSKCGEATHNAAKCPLFPKEKQPRKKKQKFTDIGETSSQAPETTSQTQHTLPTHSTI